MASADIHALARQLNDLTRRLESLERATRLDRSSVMADDGTMVDARTGIINGAAAAVAAAAALEQVVTAQATADGKVTVFYGDMAPTEAADNPEYGDQWIQTPSGSLYRYDGDSWVLSQDQSKAAEALEAAQNAQDTADGKIVAYYQPTEPTTGSQGDLWYDTDADNRVYRYDAGAWTPLPLGTAALATEIVGKTLTGGLIRTAVDGSRVELDDDGGLVAYAADGVTKNVVIYNKDELENPTAPFTGLQIGPLGALRLRGGSADDAAIGKAGNGDALQIRGAIDVLKGSGINLYENVSTSGLDGDNDPYNGSMRFYTNQLQTLKLLKDGVAVFRGGIRAAEMRPLSATGGDATTRSVTTFAVVTNGPLVQFTAPTSGAVLITLTIYLRSSVIGTQSQAGMEVRTGTTAGGGTQIVAPTALLVNGNVGWTRAGTTLLVAGLTPGATHTVRAMFRSDVAASDVYASEHSFVVQPCF
jgi:hypothetical protein